MHDHEKNYVAAGWNAAHDLRWIEAGRSTFAPVAMGLDGEDE